MESQADMIMSNIRDLCALCKTMECCPEHCCNVLYTIILIMWNDNSGILVDVQIVNIAELTNIIKERLFKQTQILQSYLSKLFYFIRFILYLDQLAKKK